MGEVVDHVDIEAPPDKIFDLVRDVEAVMKLMPEGWDVEVTKLTEGSIR